MIVFNEQEYERHFSFDAGAGTIIIKAPYNIETYINKLKDSLEYGKEIEDEISIQDINGKDIDINSKHLLYTLCAHYGICPKLLEIDEYKDLPALELQKISGQIIWNENRTYDDPRQVDKEDIQQTLMMNKHERNILKNSGFIGDDCINLLRDFFDAKKRLNEECIYTKELDIFLHSLSRHTNSHPVSSNASTSYAQLIELYFKYPAIADCLLQLTQRDQSALLNMIGCREYARCSDYKDAKNLEMINAEKVNNLLAYIGNNATFEVLLHMSNEMLTESHVGNAKLISTSFYADEDPQQIFVVPNFDEMVEGHDEHKQGKWVCLNLNLEGDANENNYSKLVRIVEALNDKLIYDKCEGNKFCRQIDLEDLVEPELLEQMKHEYRLSQMQNLLAELVMYANIGVSNYAPKDLVIKSFINGYYDVGNNTCINFIQPDEKLEINYSVATKNYSVSDFIPNHNRIYQLECEKRHDIPFLSLSEAQIKMIDDEFIRAIAKDISSPYHHILDRNGKLMDQKVQEAHMKPWHPNAYETLKQMFIKKFKHAPRILPQISYAIQKYFNGDMKGYIESFDYKNISKIIGPKTPIMLKLSSCFNWSETPKELQYILRCYTKDDNIQSICNNKNLLIEFYKNAREKDVIELINMLDKINPNVLDTINNKIEQINQSNDIATKNALRIEISNELANIISVLKLEVGRIDARKAEEEYKYNVINNSSELLGDDICVMSGPYRMYFLNSMDYRHFSVGYDTSCCQHIGGAGEECVIAATGSPHCGTLVIETHDGDIKAQAFVWEGLNKNGDKVLVLDNMEFANDREVKDYLEIIYGFCKESPYDNIQIGLGYNQSMSNVGPEVCEQEIAQQPQIIALDGEEYYSDYNSAIHLKQHGEVLISINGPKYYKQEFVTPTIIESDTHAINLSSDALIAQQYDSFYDKPSKITMVINSEGILIEPDEKKSVYPFETTNINEENYIAKWNHIGEGDIALVATFTGEQVIIKPIVLECECICSPNPAQCQTIMSEINRLKEKYPNIDITLKLPERFPTYNVDDLIIKINTIQDLEIINKDNYESYNTLRNGMLSSLTFVDTQEQHINYGDYYYYGDLYDDIDDEMWERGEIDGEELRRIEEEETEVEV